MQLDLPLTDGRYQLTDKEADFAHVMPALSAWGDRWLDKGKGAPIKIMHTECGHPAGPRIACAHCAGDLGAGHLGAEPGPGYPANGLAIFMDS